MSIVELGHLVEVLSGILEGKEWECVWLEMDDEGERQVWESPRGRDVEYCIKNRIPMRLRPEPLKPVVNQSQDLGDHTPHPLLETAKQIAEIHAVIVRVSLSGDALRKAARAVVDARYSGGDWSVLDNAIGELEDFVGRTP